MMQKVGVTISQTIIKPIEEIVLFPLVCVRIIWGVVRELDESSNILMHRHRALLEVLEVFLFSSITPWET
jgi:hypothetical protein